MLNQLDTANMSDLPMIMRFLLQTATAEKIEDVILKIRQKLDFKALAKVQAAEKDVVSFRPANAPVDKGMVPEALVLGKNSRHYSQYHSSLLTLPELESIKIGLQFHKFISDAWIKVINDKESPVSRPLTTYIDTLTSSKLCTRFLEKNQERLQDHRRVGFIYHVLHATD